MATMTNEQIEQKMSRLKQLTAEVNQIMNELKEAGAWPLDDEELDEVTGGTMRSPLLGFDKLKLQSSIRKVSTSSKIKKG